MKPIILSSDTLPVLAGCSFCVANEAFVHADRLLGFHVLIYVVSGCIYVTEDDVDYEVRAGELLFLRSGVRHYGKKATPKGTSWYFAHFYMEEPKSASVPVQTRFAPGETEPLRCQMELPKYVKGLEQSRAAGLIAELADSLHAAYPMAIWNANIRLFSVLTEIAVGSLPTHIEETLSDRIAAYLSEHISDNFSADALEEQFFLSYKYMAAVFKKEKQITLHQYHTRARMTRACHMLCTTMKTVGEISEELGYHDMLYFSRCFHQTIGMSPTGYRRARMLNY